MTVSVSWLKKQMVQFTKVAKAKSGSLWCKPADGEKKHAHCCTLHTHCVFFVLFFLPAHVVYTDYTSYRGDVGGPAEHAQRLGPPQRLLAAVRLVLPWLDLCLLCVLSSSFLLWNTSHPASKDSITHVL